MYNYKDKKIIIIGLGQTGLSCVNFFLSLNIIPLVIDTRITSPYKKYLPIKVKCHFGSWNYDWLMSSDLIVISPGISIFIPVLKKAANKGIEIIGDIELFCREINKPIIAITGSNGKSTVTHLVYKMAKIANFHVGIGGNIGNPVLTLLKKKYDLYILELSSFQLETIYSLKATVATILNITPDHIDRYPGGFQQYCNIKSRIYNNAKICIFNKQDFNTRPLLYQDTHCISVGVNNGDYQLNTKKKIIQIKGEFIIDINIIKLIGQHNYINCLFALALADMICIPRQASIFMLTQYEGLPYRCQLVHEYKGVKWINDSKATNINSTKAALNSLKTIGNIYLLLGGDGKSANFLELKPYIRAKNIKLCCFGRDGYQLSKLKKKSLLFDTMEQCLHVIKKKIQFGDMVLLSPACSSLDQFHNFEHRGKIFTQLAKRLGTF